MGTYPNTQPYAHCKHSTIVIRDIYRRYPCKYGTKSKENVAKAEHLQQFHPRSHHTSKVGYRKTLRDVVQFIFEQECFIVLQPVLARGYSLILKCYVRYDFELFWSKIG